jgi:hypothetical protein
MYLLLSLLSLFFEKLGNARLIRGHAAKPD